MIPPISEIQYSDLVSGKIKSVEHGKASVCYDPEFDEFVMKSKKCTHILPRASNDVVAVSQHWCMFAGFFS